MTDTDYLRNQLVRLIDGHDARMTFDDAVAEFPDDAINAFPRNVDYTPWHLVEHVRLTQADIVDYIVNRDYVESVWPDEFWPARDATATPEQFAETIAGFRRDQATLREIVSDPATDLLATIPGTRGHTILREVRIVGDHNAYHTGEFAVLRQVMGTWPAGREP